MRRQLENAGLQVVKFISATGLPRAPFGDWHTVHPELGAVQFVHTKDGTTIHGQGRICTAPRCTSAAHVTRLLNKLR